ncbi:hypothetical protein BIW11_02774 [Tropilaelaps mercedesae]|uniref:Uncharacterized protein n=1 Tax=Tropilaelaps mercedesae TaxID=418985 RepID=A0A1V9XXT6_9ACAR|nr:hypothetical protein BIW11_02774 [Tropilaelaps mercedesae]
MSCLTEVGLSDTAWASQRVNRRFFYKSSAGPSATFCPGCDITLQAVLQDLAGRVSVEEVGRTLGPHNRPSAMTKRPLGWRSPAEPPISAGRNSPQLQNIKPTGLDDQKLSSYLLYELGGRKGRMTK